MFESTLEYLSQNFFYEEEDRATYVQYRIAHCAETDRDVLLSCALVAYNDEGGREVHEFKFEFIVLSNDETHEAFSTMERDVAASYIPADIRGAIVDYVEMGLQLLLKLVRPARVFRVTKSRGLPEKALAKHHRITQVLVNSGYTMYDEGIDEYGRNYWDMLA